MSGVATLLAREKDLAVGIGTFDQPAKYLNQDYNLLKKKCLQAGKLFIDNTFPGVPSALGFNELGPGSPRSKGVVWKRPGEICANPQFTIGGMSSTDACQGALPDCWLLAAIAALTTNKNAILHVIPDGQSFQVNYAGIFHFQFWQFGQWVDVVIDDQLPTVNGQLLFDHSPGQNEFWSVLLEKAYAKLNGCYECLAGGSLTEAFEDFTGGISENYNLNKAPENLFQIICKALNAGSLLGSYLDFSGPDDKEERTPQNLIKRHGYSILDAKEINYKNGKEQLLRIRNPWGQVEWNGAWSDNAPEWNDVSPDVQSRLDYKAEDGEFWMSFSDYMKNYVRLEICNLSPDTQGSGTVHQWTTSQFEGVWRIGSTAGGCIDHKATFRMNPQFYFKLLEEDDDRNVRGCSFVVGLMQKNARRNRIIDQDLNIIGFAIFQVPDKYKGLTNIRLGNDVLLKQDPIAISSTFIDDREECDRFTLPPGDYVIIPSTQEPHKNGNFILRFFFEKKAVASRMELPTNAEIYEPKITASVVDSHSRQLGASKDSPISAFKLLQLLNKQIAQRNDIKCSGFKIDICRNMISLLDKNGKGTIGLTEFAVLWEKIQKYLDIFKKYDTDKNGTIPSYLLRDALHEAGFQMRGDVLHAVVLNFAEESLTLNADRFVGCLFRLELLFKIFKTIDKDKSGTVQLSLGQWLLLGVF
ncbi:calpain-2 catalytic subunit-like [Erpetoichthys calabaricus]|uniref:calpain-2 catalytic subunit-like n=1 Tax=Erpetoichthys calabaricus TaxID=27687 RepID=UPI00109FBBB7|nr:calpain-2 catalytic subunit-like [Erpetoichthys calabaricus]